MAVLLPLQRRAYVAFQMRYIIGDEVSQVAVLCITPSSLDRIQFRSVSGQPLEVDNFESRVRNALCRGAVARSGFVMGVLPMVCFVVGWLAWRSPRNVNPQENNTPQRDESGVRLRLGSRETVLPSKVKVKLSRLEI